VPSLPRTSTCSALKSLLATTRTARLKQHKRIVSPAEFLNPQDTADTFNLQALHGRMRAEYLELVESGAYTPARSARPVAHLADAEANKLAQDTLATTKAAAGAVSPKPAKQNLIQQLNEGVVFNEMCFGCGTKRATCDKSTCDRSWQTNNVGSKVKHGLMWFLWCEDCQKYMLHNKDGHAKYAKRQELNKKRRAAKQKETAARLATSDDGPADGADSPADSADTQGLFAQYINPFYCDTETDNHE